LPDVTETSSVYVQPKESVSTRMITHNWCDPTTWFGRAARKDAVALTNPTGDGIRWVSPDKHWIDLNHGRYPQENGIKASYLPQVFVGGVQKTEREPFAEVGGDFRIDYTTGEVFFFESQAGAQVTANYSHATTSEFIICPNPGKVLKIFRSEIQFTSDVILKDTIIFQSFVYNPADLPNKVPYGAPVVYKTMGDYEDQARGIYPYAQPIGGPARGYTQGRVTYPFEYDTVIALDSAVGAEIRVYLENHVPYEGKKATATFHCLVSESGA
jgi:hypothetical protein